MEFDVSGVEDKFLEIDGEKYYQWTPIISLVSAQMRQISGYRWGQAMYNVLTVLGQAGLDPLDTWNDFYQQPNKELAQIEFKKRFVIEDDYIIPRDVTAGTPAVVGA